MCRETYNKIYKPGYNVNIRKFHKVPATNQIQNKSKFVGLY